MRKEGRCELRDQPHMPEIIKAGKEINRMKKLGERQARINNEMEPEVNKILNKRDIKRRKELQERIERECRSDIEQFVKNDFRK